MRKINMIKTVSAVTFASSLLLASCTGNFEDLNTHPTDVYDDQMTEIEKVGSVFPVMTYLLNPQQENNSQMTEQWWDHSMVVILRVLTNGTVPILARSIHNLTGWILLSRICLRISILTF